MLIGCDLLPHVILDNQVVGPMGTPMALHTIFGRAILGQYSGNSSNQLINVVTMVNPDPVDDILTRFWKVEEPPDSPALFTPNEELVQRHYADTSCTRTLSSHSAKKE